MNNYDNNESNVYQYYFKETDPFFDEAIKAQKKKSKAKMKKTIGALVAAFAFTVSVSVGSIAVYDKYFLDGKIANDGGTSIVNRDSGVYSSGTVYLPTATKDALTIPQIYEKSISSVVSISVEQRVGNYAMGTGTGTGVIMSADGYIITNAHVVDGASAMSVTTYDGQEFSAKLIGSDSKVDIAIIKVEATGLTPATFGTSQDVTHGEPAVVIGNPLGLSFAGTVTDGIISSTSREIKMNGVIMELIQTNAAINPGNSGGPLINCRGEVVGIVNSKIAAEDVEGIGFAIPIDTALSVAEDFIKYGFVKNRPMMGITVTEIDAYTAQRAGVEPGVRVEAVQDGSAAAKAGILPGDRILKINATEIVTYEDLEYAKGKFKAGDTVEITVSREGAQQVLTLTFMESTNN